MDGLTERVTTMLSMTTKDMTVYVAGDLPLCNAIEKGWPSRKVVLAPQGTSDITGKGLLIMGQDEFLIKF